MINIMEQKENSKLGTYLFFQVQSRQHYPVRWLSSPRRQRHRDGYEGAERRCEDDGSMPHRPSELQ